MFSYLVRDADTEDPVSSNVPDGVKIVSGRESGAASTEPLWNELSSSLSMYWWVLVWGKLKYVVVNYKVLSLLFGKFWWDSYNEWVFGRFLELSSFSLFHIVSFWWVSVGHHRGHHHQHQRRHPAPQHRCQHGQNPNVNLSYSCNCKLIRVKLSPIKQVYSASQFTLSRSPSQNFSGQV